MFYKRAAKTKKKHYRLDYSLNCLLKCGKNVCLRNSFLFNLIFLRIKFLDHREVIREKIILIIMALAVCKKFIEVC